MPNHPFLFYQSTAEPVTVPAAAPESITLDKWDSPDHTTFRRARGFPVAAVAYAEPLLAIEEPVADGGGTALRSQLRTLIYVQQAAPVFVPAVAPETITPDKWQGTDGTIFTRERFLPGSGEEQPKLGTALSAPPDKWQSHRSAVVFQRPNFAAMGASQHMGGFTSFFVPDISLWDSTHTPIFSRRRFMRGVETEEIPRVPTAAPGISLDQWQSHRSAVVFNRTRWRVVETEEIPRLPTAAAPETITIDKWDAQDGPVFRRRRFVVVEGEEIPRLPTAAAPPAVTLDQWQSHRSAVIFNRYRFAAFIGAQRVSGFTTTHVPELTLWDSPTAARPSFATRRFRTVETQELPRIPTPDSILVEKWQSPRVGVPFRRPRFIAPEVAESPSIIFAEPIRLDKWQSKFGPVFKKPRFLHGQSTMELIDVLLVPFQPALTPPRILTLATTALHSFELSGTITKVLTFAGNTYTLTFSGTDQKLLSFASTGTKTMTVVAETTHSVEVGTTPTHEVTIRMGEPPS